MNIDEILNNEILPHVKEHGGYLIYYSNPFKLQLGFKCTKTNKEFMIGLMKFKRAFGSNLYKMIATKDENFLDLLNSGKFEELINWL